jgi:hypothetical protein
MFGGAKPAEEAKNDTTVEETSKPAENTQATPEEVNKEEIKKDETPSEE